MCLTHKTIFPTNSKSAKIPYVCFMTMHWQDVCIIPTYHISCHIDLTESFLISKHFILNPKILKHANCCIDITNFPNNLYFDTSLH